MLKLFNSKNTEIKQKLKHTLWCINAEKNVDEAWVEEKTGMYAVLCNLILEGFVNLLNK